MPGAEHQEATQAKTTRKRDAACREFRNQLQQADVDPTEAYAYIMEEMGGPKGFSAEYVAACMSAKLGSHQRTVLLLGVVKMAQLAQEHAPPPINHKLLSNEDLEREAERLMTKVLRQDPE